MIPSFPFSKYAGSGNDFIMIDAREKSIPFTPPSIKALCDRKYGIGGDGLIMLIKGERVHYKMRIFNSDGHEAEMCGNGLRCFKLFLEELGISEPIVHVETLLKVHELRKMGVEVQADMGLPSGLKTNIHLDKGIVVDYIDTGVPHAVHFVEDLKNVDIGSHGPYIRHHPEFKPKGANANFVKKINENTIEIRTYERGVEGETLACGTGACAAAILSALKYQMKSPIQVIPLSQEPLTIDFTWENSHITKLKLTGPAKKIFHGSFHLKETYAPEKRFC